jgi:hypothetical protein
LELYFRWLDQHERRAEHEESTLGLILCSSKDKENIELLQLNQGEIHVAEYLTALPEKKLLAAKLHDPVIRGREQLARPQDVPEESKEGNLLLSPLYEDKTVCCLLISNLGLVWGRYSNALETKLTTGWSRWRFVNCQQIRGPADDDLENLRPTYVLQSEPPVSLATSTISPRPW